MKSLAVYLFLRLPLLFLLLSQHIYADTAASTKSASRGTTKYLSTRTTTTQQPPTLHAPQRRRTPLPTAVMTHPTATTIKAKTSSAAARGTQSAALQRRHSDPQLKAHDVNVKTNLDGKSNKSNNSGSPSVTNSAASTLRSTRLVRDAESGVRQNRSLQSSSQRNANGDVEVHVAGGNTRKYKYIDRRLQQHNDNGKSIFNNNNATMTSSSHSVPAASTIRNRNGTRQSPPNTGTYLAAASSQSSAYLQPNDTSNLQLRNSADNTKVANSTRAQQQSAKTPRMIQRLVAGHIQNAEGHSRYQVSAVTTNSTVTNFTTTLKPSVSNLRPRSSSLSSSYRLSKTNSQVTQTNTESPANRLKYRSQSTPRLYNKSDERDDDEALLEDSGDFDNWDNGILRLSAGSGKESAIKTKKNKDDGKKTLSDQVRDGKYGLIEKELFRRPPKRPGVLSYLPNKETPFDNERTYGGLNEEDIWLAEDHLLVIKGGSLNDGELDEPWPPIDDYDAPGRQIKIPPHPKVPPPFPVQLEENGPIQFIGNNKFTVVYPIANESIPVYSAGPEANYPSSETESDDEKNLLTRPGATHDATQSEPGYLYPAPYPPWLYHNQTFVNPFLNNARPISFPGLGPFPFNRNGSLDSANGTDYFDEDDPSLYYPPAYSFVYKSNYSNPVAPGPLVPGIVLPPPANQFIRLEKPDTKTGVTTVAPPQRHKTYSTTTSTTTTTTTSTTTAPFRQVITKISEYTPKTIIITPSPPVQPSTPAPRPQQTTPPPHASATPPTVRPHIIEAIPVPVAVPIPIYPSNKYPTRPNTISFVPTTARPNADTLSKTNPIYYEYFEAKRQPTVTSNIIDDFLSTTEKPPVSLAKPIKLYATSKRPFKKQSQRQYLQQVKQQQQQQPQQPPQYVPEGIVYITPKPELRYKRPPQQEPVAVPVFKQRPLENFEREVNAIRETLRYYQNQQLRDNNIPRTPKSKPVYEYSFDASKNLANVGDGNFQAPSEYDEEPFKPMVTYSPPVDDENAFHAIAVEKVDDEQKQQLQQREQEQREEDLPRLKYQSTTTLVPVQPDLPYAPNAPLGRPKKLRFGAKYLQHPLLAEYRNEPDDQSTPGTIIGTQTPWVSVSPTSEQPVGYVLPRGQQQTHTNRLQLPPPTRQRGFTGYYYGGPPLHVRQNNRFYEEPFQNANSQLRKIVNYRPLPQQQQQHHPQQQQQQSPIWNLENDTYVNYAPNRPPLNPDAEFINPYQPLPYGNQVQRYSTPPLSHQSQYYAPQQRLQHAPPPSQLQAQRQYQPQISLHRDVLVNYRQPLPPVNPDSEYITHPHVVRNQANPQVYRSNTYRLPPPAAQQSLAEQDNQYYITPKYRRSNNSNKGSGGNGGSDANSNTNNSGNLGNNGNNGK